jgi:hypothetical protein
MTIPLMHESHQNEVRFNGAQSISSEVTVSARRRFHPLPVEVDLPPSLELPVSGLWGFPSVAKDQV